MMEALSKEAVRQAGMEMGGKIKSGLDLSLRQLVNPEYAELSLPTLFFIMGILAFLFRSRKKGTLIPLLLFLGAEGVLWLLLGFAGRLPERVAFSLHLTMMLGLAACFARLWFEKEENGKGNLWKRVTAPLILFLCLGAVSI